MFWLAEVFNGSHSAEEMKRLENWAHRERAEALSGLLSGFGDGLRGGAKALARLLGSGLAHGYGRVSRWRRWRAAIRELNALSDHALNDIGLVRGDIPSVVAAMIEREDRKAERPVAPLRSVPAARESTIREDARTGWKRAA